MKKTMCIAGVILLITSMTLSAQPLAGEAYFSDVEGEPLTQSQMEDIEGEGLFTSLLGGFALGAVSYLGSCMSRNQQPTFKGAFAGGCVGAISVYSSSLGVVAGMGVSAGFGFRVPSHYPHIR